MKNSTDLHSFVLKPSTIPAAGVGVFILHDVATGTHMEVFLEDFQEELRDEKDVPEELQAYCLTQKMASFYAPNFSIG